MRAREHDTRWQRVAGLASLALFLAGPISAHFAMLPALSGFLLFVAGGALGLLTSVTALVKGFRRGLGNARAGLLLGAIPAITLVWQVASVRDYPRINDISTDLDKPPRFVHAKTLPPNRDRDLSYPEGFADIVRATYPDLGPLRLSDPPRKVFDRAMLVAKGVPGWRITLVNADKLFFEGVATTELFRFQDDFIVRVSGEDGGSRVDMRSKSRDGQGDLGANADRIRVFLGKLRAMSL